MVPSRCPLCHRLYCDHTPAERGQTYEEMMGDVPIRGQRFKAPDGEIVVFSRTSGTGHLIFHPEGEPSMQDSWAWTPEQYRRELYEKRIEPIE